MPNFGNAVVEEVKVVQPKAYKPITPRPFSSRPEVPLDPLEVWVYHIPKGNVFEGAYFCYKAQNYRGLDTLYIDIGRAAPIDPSDVTKGCVRRPLKEELVQWVLDNCYETRPIVKDIYQGEDFKRRGFPGGLAWC